MKILGLSATALVVAAAVVSGPEAGAETSARCELPRGSERVSLDAATFTTRIDNPWWPMRPGARWVYRETDAAGARQRVVVTVTSRTRRVANGVTARVVHDAVTEGGRAVEITDDWYAQDVCGNVWYLGEDTKEYENGKLVSTEGSWEAGVGGAQPGVIMPAGPLPGMRYRQEHYAGHAEDRASIFSRTEQVEVPSGFYARGRVVMTRELNPLEPRVLEYKFYARGVGPVLSVAVSGGSDREELVSYRPGRRARM
jgi:hypothetical protein